ncbi:hypothetical protein GPECTOR_28g751 [Gonium pectorale]|uniref:Uncharacterized protein n=1 Tax=Gonium pectorale TaxID=33097 RepID=A0A150GEU2_GONPE|nr:hypothetical protein GPECTOR_28g751 [Gonium pectorale]|eukprot:KXZ48344.1 hypothetical protein GPECTOR_28g751 [Gonium pectorale]
MDSSLLVWALRIRETEALLKSRQQEREAQAARRKALEGALRAREADQARLQQRIFRAQEGCASAQRLALQHLSDLQKEQARADGGERLMGLRVAHRCLASERRRLESAIEAEAARCYRYSERVCEYEQQLKEPVAQLEAEVEKAEQRLDVARSTYDMVALTAAVRQKREQREGLKEEVRAKRAACEAAEQQAAELLDRVHKHERANSEAVEQRQAALREGRNRLAAAQQRRSEAHQSLQDVRSQRMAAASHLADLQRAIDAAGQTLACLGAPLAPDPHPHPQ